MKLLSDIELHSKIRDINIEHDEVVIGSSLEALVYCALNNVPLLSTRLSPPPHFATHNLDLTVLGIQNNNNSSLWLWERLFFYLSMAGLLPLSNKAISLRASDNVIKAATSKARMAKITFNKLTVFDDFSVSGIGTPSTPTDQKCTVYDWFNVRSGMKHDHDTLYSEEDFVKQIIFYKTLRLDGNHQSKDAVAISYLTQEELEQFEYSDINARFKTLYLMKESGIRGARNGRDMEDKTKYKYYAVKIENASREIIPPRPLYTPFDNIDFNYDSLNDIMINNPLKTSYVHDLIQRACND